MSLFPSQLTKRILTVTIILTIIPLIIMMILIPISIIKQGKEDKKRILFGVVDRLDGNLKLSYHEILETEGALNKEPKQQIYLLNKILQPRVDSISNSFPDIGMGYYSIELDHIVAIAPGFNKSKLIRVPHDKYPYFNIYKTRQAEYGEFNNSFGWNGKPIIFYAKPIVRNGVIIGHAWANIKTDDVYKNAFVNTTVIIVAWVILIGIIISSLCIFVKKMKHDLEKFASSFIDDENIPTAMIPEFSPIFNIVKEHSKNIKQANLLLCQEIEERRNAEKELQTIKERLLFLLANSPAVFYSAKPFGDYGTTFISDNVKTIFGYEPDQFIRTSFFKDRIHPDDVERILSEISLLAEKGSGTFEYRFLHKDGTYRWTQDRVEYIRDKQGNPLEVIGCWQDITERKITDEELSRLDRLNLIGQMAAGIGHEVRNPMTTVRGFLQMLSKKPKFAAEKEYFDLMISELDRANSIITDFLSIGKSSSKEIHQLHSLNKIIEDLFPLLQANAINSYKKIQTETLPVPELNINRKEIHQLILNLVRNGFEAMPEGGKVTIKTYLDGEGVILAIQDEGKGIEPSILDKLGTPFLTTKEQGTGLGLAVCYSIAARNNAVIDINTGPEGTTFFVKFKVIDKTQ